MKIVGLTGGIATGKSTISQYLLTKNIPVIDCDLIARQVVEKDTIGLQQLIAAFGEEILTDSKELNRAKLGNIIFNHQEKRQLVNQIVHPLIDVEMKKQIENYQLMNKQLVVLDIPLLFEENYQTWCDEVLVVYIPTKLQLTRLMQRNQLSQEEAKSRIHSQMPIDEKKLLANRVVDNSQSLEKTYQQVDKWLLENTL
ncbi:dephospho-CoA kinase [Granulicatella balaenopterae]|uniref:Dephospho-CoA kinase n=1 Tax=Granulicatella balaenopterae TaxID=137733 RepID=A0A1H9HS82_9LACT|nr:dephospho-CoA kinase [Granulicatella balaenopterae]SEQ65157.1 dephospho-CoA kinase [Granulicatella balaenopterae]